MTAQTITLTAAQHSYAAVGVSKRYEANTPAPQMDAAFLENGDAFFGAFELRNNAFVILDFRTAASGAISSNADFTSAFGSADVTVTQGSNSISFNLGDIFDADSDDPFRGTILDLLGNTTFWDSLSDADITLTFDDGVEATPTLPAPEAGTVTITGPTTGSTGSNVTLGSTLGGNRRGAISYFWTVTGGNIVGAAVASTVTVARASTGDLVATLTTTATGDGTTVASGTDTATDTHTVTFSAAALPAAEAGQVTLTADDTSPQNGATVTVTATVTGARYDSLAYNWTGGTAVAGQANQREYTRATAGDIDVAVSVVATGTGTVARAGTTDTQPATLTLTFTATGEPPPVDTTTGTDTYSFGWTVIEALPPPPTFGTDEYSFGWTIVEPLPPPPTAGSDEYTFGWTVVEPLPPPPTAGSDTYRFGWTVVEPLPPPPTAGEDNYSFGWVVVDALPPPPTAGSDTYTFGWTVGGGTNLGRRTVTLELPRVAERGDTVTVTYTPPADAAFLRLQDRAGNEVAQFTIDDRLTLPNASAGTVSIVGPPAIAAGQEVIVVAQTSGGLWDRREYTWTGGAVVPGRADARSVVANDEGTINLSVEVAFIGNNGRAEAGTRATATAAFGTTVYEGAIMGTNYIRIPVNPPVRPGQLARTTYRQPAAATSRLQDVAANEVANFQIDARLPLDSVNLGAPVLREDLSGFIEQTQSVAIVHDASQQVVGQVPYLAGNNVPFDIEGYTLVPRANIGATKSQVNYQRKLAMGFMNNRGVQTGIGNVIYEHRHIIPQIGEQIAMHRQRSGAIRLSQESIPNAPPDTGDYSNVRTVVDDINFTYDADSEAVATRRRRKSVNPLP